ncbi:hypothetical protein [Corynebacterium provencense]|nr:hypothetical protein [Corynebacterium provencense]
MNHVAGPGVPGGKRTGTLPSRCHVVSPEPWSSSPVKAVESK